MKALVFEYSLPRLAYGKVLGKLNPLAYLSTFGPTRLRDIPEPKLPGDDWTIVRTGLCGICGSDTKQIFLDADFDNPLSALVSFPNVPGHEVVGVVSEVGPAVRRLKVGDRVVLNPWLSCGPRGVEPACPACRAGDYNLCESFCEGELARGMHTGNCTMVTGGFAPFLPAHEAQLFPIPASVSFAQAVLADPFSVSLHAILKAPPAEGARALVYGCGTLGLLSVAILCTFYPWTEVVAVARHPLQVRLARRMGAHHVLTPRDPNELIAEVARLTGEQLLRPAYGRPWLRGGVDVIYDTVGSAETLEVGLRIARPRSRIVVTGVSRPKRFEWTPHYFKEIELVGSNAFGVEEFEGKSLHAMEIYLQLLAEGRLHLPEFVTHCFSLADYRRALLVAEHKDRHEAVKVVFAFPGAP
jgi:threonine dehydrogenase-like Zn-dependent dehydrogenase